MADAAQLKSDVIEMNDGRKIPVVGLGTFQGSYDYTSTFDTVVSSVRSAIEIGYRHFDTAFIYDTEKGVGEAIRQKIQENAVTREDIFVTTKLWCTSHRKELVVSALKKSLSALGLDYIDMFLIHWPMAMPPSEEIFPKNEEGEILFEDDHTDITDTWQGMEECVNQGLAKSIGVSNFTIGQLKRILNSCSIKPANLQVEVNPFFNNVELVNFCQEHGIVVAAFSPIGKPNRAWIKEGDPSVFTDPTLKEIAAKYNKSAVQVALRFQVQRGIVVIPKSNSPDRQRANIDIFDFTLTAEEMEMVYKCNKDFRVLSLTHLNGSKEYPF